MQKTISIRHTKEGTGKYIYFSVECKLRLELYLKECVSNNQYLFVNYKKQQLTRQGIWKIIKKYVEKSGLDPSISTHDFRHYFGGSLAANGADIGFIATRLGIEENTARKYIKVPNNISLSLYDKYR